MRLLVRFPIVLWLLMSLVASGPLRASELELRAAERSWLAEHPVIRMGIDAGYGPYSFLDEDGHVQGVAADFMAEIEARLGIRFEFVADLSWPQLMDAVRERRLDAVATVAQLPERALVVALFGISNHDNLGGIFRNAVAFGADAVLLDPSCCDPLYRKTIRVSVGASLICPFARANSDTALMQAIKATSLKPVALSLRGEADIGRMAAAQSGIALLIGSEGHGLPDAVLTGSEGFRIPMAPGFDSLNAATATGIALHIAASALGKLGNG